MRKYTSLLIALSVASLISLAVTGTVDNAHKRVDYYFRYKSTAPPNGEATITNWEEITSTQYVLTNCPGSRSGCKLKTTSITVIMGVAYPSSVPTVTNMSGGLTTIDPIVGLSVTEVANKFN